MNRCEKCGLVIFGEHFRYPIPNTLPPKIVKVCKRCCQEILIDWITKNGKAVYALRGKNGE